MAEIIGDTSLSRSICLRAATTSDARCLWIWANDADARRKSLHSRPISWQAHTAWLRATLSDVKQCVLIAQFSKITAQPVGVVRCQLVESNSVGEISLNLDPSMRGKGWGARILAMSCPIFFHQLSVRKLRAEIEREHVASERVFRRAGFLPSGKKFSASAQRELVEWTRRFN